MIPGNLANPPVRKYLVACVGARVKPDGAVGKAARIVISPGTQRRPLTN